MQKQQESKAMRGGRGDDEPGETRREEEKEKQVAGLELLRPRVVWCLKSGSMGDAHLLDAPRNLRSHRHAQHFAAHHAFSECGYQK